MADATSTMTIKCLQGWKGTLVLSCESKLSDFLVALQEAASIDAGDVLLLIVRGKRVEPTSVEHSTALTAIGMSHNTAVMLVIRPPEERAALREREEKLQRLRQVEMACEALSARVGLQVDNRDDYSLSITNQDGTELVIEGTDRRGLALGALLHAKGAAMLAAVSPSLLSHISREFEEASGREGDGDHGDTLASCLSRTEEAYEVLEQAEAAFMLVSPRYHSLGDNFVLVLLDCMWAQLLLHLVPLLRPTTGQDGSSECNMNEGCSSAISGSIGVGDSSGGGGSAGSVTQSSGLGSEATQAAARSRLERATSLIEQLHGVDQSQLRGREDAPQQRASYVRLRLMRGALAFAAGRPDEAAAAFSAAEALRQELTVLSADEPKVEALVALGLSPQAARRTLLAHGKDVDAAAAAAVERMQEAAAKRAKRKRESELRAAYGQTARGRSIDDSALQAVTCMGYEEPIAAEALRRCENDVEASVCMLCHPGGHEAVVLAVMQRRNALGGNEGSEAGGGSGASGSAGAGKDLVDEAKVTTLLDMGFTRPAAMAALRGAAHDVTNAALALGRGEYADAMDISDESGMASPARPQGGADEARTREAKGEAGQGKGCNGEQQQAEAPPPMTTEEMEAVRRSELRDAVRASEAALVEMSGLADAAVVLQLLLSRVRGQ